MITEHLKVPYQKYDVELHRSRLGFLILISVAFIMMFAALDTLMYGAIAKKLITIRIVVGTVLILMFFINHKRWLLNAKIMSFAWSIIIIMLINALIIMINDKSSSPYYAGLNLIIVASAALLPWAWHEMLFICIIMLFSYIISCFIAMDIAISNLGNLSIFINNLFFLFSTSSFCILAAYVNSKLRFKEFCLNYELKNTVSQLQSTQAQLIQSEKMNAIGNLSAGILHEINNPLNYTMTAVQIVKMDDRVNNDADLKDTVLDIEEGMSRIKNIVSDLHNFAYPEQADQKTQFSILSAVESAIRFTSSECSDMKIITNINPELIVTAARTHIVQVLVNLITNSCKAIVKSGRDGVIILNAEQKDDRINISVSDNGIGMNEETLRKVFDPFFTTSEVGKGMGMGLSVSYTIIKNHGGILFATSKLGEGSVFSFDLSA